MKLDILAIGAHPDDVELGCAATLAKEISLGRSEGGTMSFMKNTGAQYRRKRKS